MDYIQYNKDMSDVAKLIKKMEKESERTIDQIINELRVELTFY